MTSILEEIRAVVPSGAKLSGTGWLNFNCPACGDRRERGGVLFTPTGGFRYRCFNGGCEFERPTGYEPDSGFGGRPRKVFEALGGDVRRIPMDQLLKWQNQKFNHKGEAVGTTKDLEVVFKFPTMELPEGSQLLYTAAKTNRTANKVFRVLAKKDPANVDKFPYMWAQGKYSYYYLIPFFHYHGQIVGYVGRHVYAETGEKRFIGASPTDYLFNQHIISSYRAKYLIVVESPMDAIALGSLAARGSRLTEKQVNLLKVSGKEIVLLPDIKGSEWKWFLETASENNWLIACPEFSHSISDVMRSVARNGLLLTTEIVMHSIMDPDVAEKKIRMILGRMNG